MSTNPSISPNTCAFQKHFLASCRRSSFSYASPRATIIRESLGLQNKPTKNYSFYSVLCFSVYRFYFSFEKHENLNFNLSKRISKKNYTKSAKFIFSKKKFCTNELWKIFLSHVVALFEFKVLSVIIPQHLRLAVVV